MLQTVCDAPPEKKPTAANLPMPLWQILRLNRDPFACDALPMALPIHQGIHNQWQKHQYENGIKLIIGEPYVSKTTLLRQFHERYCKRGLWLQGSPGMSVANLCKSIAIQTHTRPPKLTLPMEQQLSTVREAINQYANFFTIIIDDADLMPLTTLAALIHMIASDQQCHFSVFLSGGQDLTTRVKALTMQGEQGVPIRTTKLSSWQKKDIKRYAHTCLLRAGWKGNPPKMGRKFWEDIVQKTQGAPHLIHQALSHQFLSQIIATAKTPQASSTVQGSHGMMSLIGLSALGLSTTSFSQHCMQISDEAVAMLVTCLGSM